MCEKSIIEKKAFKERPYFFLVIPGKIKEISDRNMLYN